MADDEVIDALLKSAARPVLDHLSLRPGLRAPVAVQIEGPGCVISIRATTPAVERRILSQLTPCDRDILRLMAAQQPGRRLTASAVLTGLAKRGVVWSESTVKHSLTRLSRTFRYLEGHKSAPRGYSLIACPDLSETA